MTTDTAGAAIPKAIEDAIDAHAEAEYRFGKGACQADGRARDALEVAIVAELTSQRKTIEALKEGKTAAFDAVLELVRKHTDAAIGEPGGGYRRLLNLKAAIQSLAAKGAA